MKTRINIPNTGSRNAINSEIDLSKVDKSITWEKAAESVKDRHNPWKATRIERNRKPKSKNLVSDF